MIYLLLAIIYLSFISLGLPDALLGAAWPSMYGTFGVPVSYAGIIAMIISVGTVVSSLNSDRLTRKFGTGMVTAASVAMTAVALFGFSMSDSFWMICLWAIPYGLGAGSVDASLNNYVALHYESRHMSWLHCMWGVGVSIGPYIMGAALSGGMTWNAGYGYIAVLQVVLTAFLFMSLPLWKKMAVRNELSELKNDAEDTTANLSKKQNVNTTYANLELDADSVKEMQEKVSKSEAKKEKNNAKALTIPQILKIKGAKEIMTVFFCYCSLEQTAMLWGSSFLVMAAGLTEEKAASFASLFCIGITVGRGISGFMTMKFDDKTMIRIGQVVIGIGLLCILLPFCLLGVLTGLVLVGFGCAPIYPCVIHSTPDHFGADKSQAILGVQMASAYVGTSLMAPLFGLIANHISIHLLPVYLLIILAGMVYMHERLLRG